MDTTAGRPRRRLSSARVRRVLRTGGLTLSVGTGAVLACVFGAGTLSPGPTDATWVAAETGTSNLSTAEVPPPSLTCEGRNGQPNLLHLAPGPEDLDVTGYRITITVLDGDDADTDDDIAPDTWQSGEVTPGVPFLPANTTTDVPASTQTIGWGIASGWNYTWKGTVAVRALGPGGWASASVLHDWTIGFDIFGGGWGSCSPAIN